MKHTPLFLSLLLVLSLVLGSCGDDDPVGVDSVPEFTSINSNVMSLPGLTITIEAVVTDPAGIRSINMKYDPWFLDKTIVRESLPTSYTLAYKFKIPADESVGSVHTIPVVVTNAGGKTTEQEVVVTLNQDVQAPTINVAAPTNGTTVLIGDGDEIQLEITFEDEALAQLEISSSILNEVVALNGTTGSYSKSLNVEEIGAYEFLITITDASGNVASQSISVNVLDQLAFTQMFITEETEASKLITDLFGVPQITEASTEAGEEGFVFTSRFYADAPNTQVRFIPQGTAFSPYTFGADPDNAGQLVIGSDATVDPVVLAEVGYYEIKIDLRDLSFTTTTYTPDDTPFDQVYIIGRGVTIGTTTTCTAADGSTLCWNFASGKPFVADPNNPYRWTLELTLEDQPNDEGENGFILNANPSGWSPFWRFDNGVTPQATVPNGGSNFTYGPDKFGDYRFVFDTHLNRITAEAL